MPTVFDLSAVVKDYRALRPLRIEHLTVAAGDHVAVIGIDSAGAETFINLLTGLSLPDSGEVRVFGRATSTIETSAEWLAIVDRLGIVSPRAVLLEAFTVIQNLAIPFSLEIDPLQAEVRHRAVRLAQEVRLHPDVWDRRVADLDPALCARVRLARALALDPAVLVFEHPSAMVDAAKVKSLGCDVRGVADRRGAATLTLAADDRFAAAVGARAFRLDAATGHLSERRGGWLGRLRT